MRTKFYLYVPDKISLEKLARSGPISHWPRLRLIVSQHEMDAVVNNYRHLAPYSLSPEEASSIDAVLVVDQKEAVRHINGISYVSLSGLRDLYQQWRMAVLRPAMMSYGWRTPELLLDTRRTPKLYIDVIGTCGALFVSRPISLMQDALLGPVETRHIIKNTVARVPIPEGNCDAGVVVAPFRLLGGQRLDYKIHSMDVDELIKYTSEYLLEYLNSVREQWKTIPLFVTNFLPAALDPEGLFPKKSFLSRIRDSLDEVIKHWTKEADNCWFLDYALIASTIGLAGTEDSSVTLFAHKEVLDPFDDWIEHRTPDYEQLLGVHVEIKQREMSAALIREVQAKIFALQGQQQVKAVITDLDDTLWRGEIAGNSVEYRWPLRFAGYAEALKILKQRGIMLGIISKNDIRTVRQKWNSVVDDGSDEKLLIPLSLDDFDSIEISWESKSAAMERTLSRLGILPSSVVFVDDNPLEREQMLRAFPEIRILGAEPFSIRRELLMSATTQRPFEDHLVEVRRHSLEVRRQLSCSGEGNFLEELGLEAELRVITGRDFGLNTREVQLINKTNQWSLNGKRIEKIDNNKIVVTLNLRDRIADHGNVGVAVLDPESSRVEYLSISCRVIGLGADLLLVDYLTNVLGVKEFDYEITELNTAAQGFFEEHGTAIQEGETLRPSFINVSISEMYPLRDGK